jgi:glycosyltransferase involved in cell wall biosynthesis
MITVVIPTIKPRATLLSRAVDSVENQILRPDRIIVEHDYVKRGAPLTRDAGLQKVETDWVAFLDDDDYLYPQHLTHMLAVAKATCADYVYSWFDTCGGDPFPSYHETDPWHPDRPIQTTVTTLVRTDLAKAVGFREPATESPPDGMRAGEDWAFTLGCLHNGAKIVHLPERTWHWCHHNCHELGLNNTSGRADRW